MRRDQTVVETPLTLVSGPLGSGKTTLLRHILSRSPAGIALIINEFGELGIDSAVARRGKNVQITELDGGCVCCSLIGEFEAAVGEIIERVAPEAIVVETTGVAEPEALVIDIAEELPGTRVDGVVTVMDADGMVRFPELGSTGRIQVESADLVLLNKIDLVDPARIAALQETLHELNPRAAVVHTRHCEVDLALLFGIGRTRDIGERHQVHQPEYDSFTWRNKQPLRRECFERAVQSLDACVYRAKGFVRFPDGSCLFNYVAGRWELTPFDTSDTRLVFIGKGVKDRAPFIEEALRACES